MKKIYSLFMALITCAMLFVSCDTTIDGGDKDKENATQLVEVYDAYYSHKVVTFGETAIVGVHQCQIWGSPGVSVVKHLPCLQGTPVLSLGWEDPSCRRTAKPMHHKNWDYALEPVSSNY